MSTHVAEGSGRGRRLALAAALAIAVSSAGGYLFFLGGGEAGAETTVHAAAASDAEDSAQPEAEVVVEALPLVTYEVFLDRDPFEPVLEEADGRSGEGEAPDEELEPDEPPIGAGLPPGTIVIDPTTGQAVVVQATTGTGAGTGGEGGSGQPTNPPTGCRGEDEVVCDGRVVTLVEVGATEAGSVAKVQVDDVVYEVAQGEVFATSFRLLAIEGTCVTLLYGDDTVRLCEGQRVLK